ncbi:MAG: PAS domain-containing protein [Pseudomonadota bacterium]|nr:PAS domain-containing protein [Pseudomonadota bacterium]
MAQEAAISGAVAEVGERLTSAITRRALDYWETKRGEGIWPVRDSLRPEEIKAILPHIMILGIERDPLDFIYRLCGTEIDAHMTEPLTGRRVSELPGQRSPQPMWVLLQEAMLVGLPTTRFVPYVGRFDDYKTCEMVALPWSTQGNYIDRIVIAADFLTVAPDDTALV